MEAVLNTIIIFFWSAFFLATIVSLAMGLRHSLRKSKADPSLGKSEPQAFTPHSS